MSAPTLWRDPNFLKLWIGQTISEVGSRVTREGLPMTAVLVLAANPTQMGALAALSGAAALIAGPLVGIVADRFRHRPLMIAADLGRAALLATIPYAAWRGSLTLTHLYLVAALAGLLTITFDVLYQTFVPELVGDEQLLQANSKLAATASTAEILGPALTGILIQTFTAPRAILIDAISFLASAASLSTIRERRPPKPAPTGDLTWSELTQGFRVVFHDPVLRALALRFLTTSLTWGVFGSLYVLYAIQTLKLTPATLGFVIMLGGLSNMIGALLSPRLGARIPVGWLLAGCTFIGGLSALFIPLASGPPWRAALFMGLSQLLGDLTFPVYGIHELTLRQRRTDPAVLGRVNAVMQLLFKSMFPVGALLGGWLATTTDIRTTFYFAALGIMSGSLWILFSPVMKLGKIADVTAPS